jgi:molecular chaperone GrpE
MPEERENNRGGPPPSMLSEDAPSVNTAPVGAEAAAPATETAQATRVAELEAALAETKGAYLRALADVENTRRRAQRDRQDASQYAITGFARDLLAVADNLRRALDAVESAQRESNPDLDTLMSGIELTEKELLSVLERHGVTLIPAMGAPFDPHVHEAMFEIPDESVPTGTVVQVLQNGYTLRDRTLRPATVGVSRGGPKRPLVEDADEEDDDDNGADAEPGEGQQASARARASAYGSGGSASAAAGARVDKSL